LEEAVEQIKTRSRRYAKRQLTWFKNQMDCTEILMDGKSYSEAADEIIEKRGKYG
jgi:tRNA dimethylallyltransferase